MHSDAIDFIHSLRYAEIPATARHAARRALLDTLGVAAAGSVTEASRILRDHAVRFHAAGAEGAPLLFDGRRTAPPGAAMAGAGTIDAIDAHDGHRLTKGHVGAAVVPALLAYCDELAPCGGEEFLTRLVVGYEIATRAGIALHATVADYHTSGAWNTLGAAAIGARALNLSDEQSAHALGIAEYYGPRSQMMRVIDYPSMVKDGSAMGAFNGVAAALLAQEGFTGAPAITMVDEKADEIWADLGRRWRVEEQYFKAYPVCRWAQPAVEAVLSLVHAKGEAPIPASQIAGITIHSFTEATRLVLRRPKNTDEAQYSLPFPVAAAVVHGKLGVAEIDGPELADPEVLKLSDTVRMVAEPLYDDRFPGERWAHAVLELKGGRRLVSAPCTARGDPERPFSDSRLTDKFHELAAPVLGESEREVIITGCLTVDQQDGVAALATVLYGRALDSAHSSLMASVR